MRRKEVENDKRDNKNDGRGVRRRMKRERKTTKRRRVKRERKTTKRRRMSERQRKEEENDEERKEE